MRVLITGITGFVGSYLAEHLLAEGGHVVYGLSRQGRWSANLAHLANQTQLFEADLADSNALAKVLDEVKPQWLFHLAGYANTGQSFREPRKCWKDNLEATQNLYDALVKVGQSPRILYASTGLIYGDPDHVNESCTEATILKPTSPYAASKAATDIMSYQYSRTANLPILRLRLFNQLGARQSRDYALPSFARQIAMAEAGHQEPIIRTGDLSPFRDITDVRDMVRAMRLVIETGVPGEAYNAGSGEARPMRVFLQELVKLANIQLTVEEKIDPNRRADTAISKADITKLHRCTGWKPIFTIPQTLDALLNYWRSTIAQYPPGV